MSLLKEINEGKARGMTYDQLKVGEEYKLMDEDGTWFKGKITKVEPSGNEEDVAIVHYVYTDDHYGTKGNDDTFEVSMDDDVFMKENVHIVETKSLGKKVIIIKGADKGKLGYIREIKHGAYKGADKSFYIDLEDDEQANNLPGSAFRLVKESATNDAFYRSVIHNAIRKTIQLNKRDPQFVDQIEEIINQAVDEFNEGIK
jgi:hypothetical protein